MTYCLNFPSTLQIFGQWLYDWQALIAGILALIAALIAANKVQKQIIQSETHEQERRLRHFNAVRASLPLALSGMCAYALKMMHELRMLHRFMRKPAAKFPPSSFNPPLTPSDLVKPLQDMIEAIPDSNVINLISEIIGEIQVLSSRVFSMTDTEESKYSVIDKRNINVYIVQAARVYALTVSLFEFARREQETGPIRVGWDEVTKALNIANIREDDFPELFSHLENRSQRTTSAWANSLP